jgi:hypothetical protein
LDNNWKYGNSKRKLLAGAGTTSLGLGILEDQTSADSNYCNRRIYRCRSSSNKNNYSKLTGGKYGTYKNIHRS